MVKFHRSKSLYSKYFQLQDFLTPKYIFSGYYNVKKYMYRHQYISRRFLGQRVLSSSPICMFQNDAQNKGAGANFLYLTLPDSRDFQKNSISDKPSYELCSEVTHPASNRLYSFFERSLN